MSNPLPNVELTEKFLGEHVPEFFAVQDISDVGAAFTEYMGRVEEVAGPRGKNQSVFSWDDVHSIGLEISPATSRLDPRRRRIVAMAGSMTLGIGHSLVRNTANRDLDFGTSGRVRTTEKGTLILVDGEGYVKAGLSEPNEEVDPSYGDPTPYILEKLGWAKLIELKTHQGADWGHGYEVLTDYLRGIGRIGTAGLPHVGMATAHEIKFSEELAGQDRNALAYSSASNYTLTSSSVGELLKDPRFFALYERDLKRGLFTNVADWIAGRLDSLVGQRANELYLGRSVSSELPYLDEPDYVNVDNN